MTDDLKQEAVRLKEELIIYKNFCKWLDEYCDTVIADDVDSIVIRRKMKSMGVNPSE